jgi:hypothetical protein
MLPAWVLIGEISELLPALDLGLEVVELPPLDCGLEVVELPPYKWKYSGVTFSKH